VLAGSAVVRVSLAPVDFRLDLDGLSLRAQALRWHNLFGSNSITPLPGVPW